MFRLTDETMLERVEGALLRARDRSIQVSSWWWNILGLLFVIVSMGFFLYARGQAGPREEPKRIEFEPQVWYSATRNVTSSETASQRQPLEHRGPSNWEPEPGAPV